MLTVPGRSMRVKVVTGLWQLITSSSLAGLYHLKCKSEFARRRCVVTKRRRNYRSDRGARARAVC